MAAAWKKQALDNLLQKALKCVTEYVALMKSLAFNLQHTVVVLAIVVNPRWMPHSLKCMLMQLLTDYGHAPLMI